MGRAVIEEMKQENRVVTGWLLYYPERKQSYDERRDDIIHGSSRPRLSEAPGNAYISDTTGRKGDKLATMDERDGAWLKLMEDVYPRLPWKMRLLVDLKRKHKIGVKGRPTNWVVALEFSEGVSRKTGKDYTAGAETIRHWWDMVVEYAAREAAKRGLL